MHSRKLADPSGGNNTPSSRADLVLGQYRHWAAPEQRLALEGKEGPSELLARCAVLPFPEGLLIHRDLSTRKHRFISGALYGLILRPKRLVSRRRLQLFGRAWRPVLSPFIFYSCVPIGISVYLCARPLCSRGS
jgi:hypothetical protein